MFKKLFCTVILPYNLKFLRVKFSRGLKIQGFARFSKSACEGPKFARPDKKSSLLKILGYIAISVQCFYYILYITHMHVVTKRTI